MDRQTEDEESPGAGDEPQLDVGASWSRRYRKEVESSDDVSSSGLPVAPLYHPRNPDAEYQTRIGWPGHYPFTRGASVEMYRDEPWVMGMYSGYGSPESTNERIRSLLAQGQRGFSVALDLPTQMGYDSDHPMAEGEVGKVGVAIDSLKDVEALFAGIELDQVRQIRTTANAIGPIAVAMFIVGAERNGYAPTDFRVMLQNDSLKEYLARGTQIFPPEAGLRFSVDVIEYCAANLPNWEPIEFCGYHIRDSGSNAIQEVAIAMANGQAYIEEALARGLSIDDFAPSLFMFLSSGLDLFEEVAKFRAARRLWAHMMREGYQAKNHDSARLKLFCYTLGSPQAVQQPLNNIVRVSYQALAAVLGGVQTLATSSFDEALGLPSDEAVQVALRTQQILSEETGVRRTIDPLGGSYFVEELTSQIEAAIDAYRDQIAEQGGAVQALKKGWLHAEVEEQAYRHQLEVESGSRVVVGVNRHASESLGAITRTIKVDESFEKEQRAKLQALRAERDSEQVIAALDALQRGVVNGENSIPYLLDAVRAYATIGEICDRLSKAVGRYVPGSLDAS